LKRLEDRALIFSSALWTRKGQGETIERAALDEMRSRLAHLAAVQEAAPPCPDDWGALRVIPDSVELWSEAPDRLRERRLFRRDGEAWRLELLSP
jgi:pyridoxamine 5'-phosphate oxidase